MIRRLLLCLFALPALANAQPLHSQVLSPAGHDVWYIELPQAEKVAIHLIFPSDWAFTSRARAFTQSLGPDMMYSGGAGPWSGREFSNNSLDLSAFSDLSSDARSVTFRLSLNVDLAADGTTLFNQLLAHPQFDPRWLARETRQAKQDATLPRTEAANRAFAALTTLQFGGSPLAEVSLDDTPDAYDLVTPELLTDWHRSVFHTGGLTAVIAGPIAEETALSLIDTLLNGLPSDGPAVSDPPMGDLTPRSVFLIDAQATGAFALYRGAVLPAQRDGPSDAAMALAGLMFAGGGLNAPLFEALRTELRATYGFSSSASEEDWGGVALTFGGDLDLDALPKLDAIVQDTYAGYLAEGPAEEAVTALTGQVAATIPLRFQRADSIAALAADVAFREAGSLSEALDAYDHFANATAADMVEALKEFPAPGDFIRIYVGDTQPEGFDGCVLEDEAAILSEC